MGLEFVSHITVTYICYCDLTRKMTVFWVKPNTIFSFSPKKPAFFLVKHRSSLYYDIMTNDIMTNELMTNETEPNKDYVLHLVFNQKIIEFDTS